MNGDDLIVAVPWLVFAAGLAVIGWRLVAGRGLRRERRPGAPGKGARSSGCRADRPGMGQPTGNLPTDRRPCRHRRGSA